MTDEASPSLHEVLARGIELGLRDVGADQAGCTPSFLTGHVIRELRAAGMHPGTLRGCLAQVVTELLRGGQTYRDRCMAAYAVLAPDGTAVCAHGQPLWLANCPKCDAPPSPRPTGEDTP